LQSSGSYPAGSPSLYTLVSAARRFDIPLERIFNSHIFTDSAPDDASTLSRHRDQEPDAAHAIAMLIDATSEAGDMLAQTELQTVAQSIASGASAEHDEFDLAADLESPEPLNPTTKMSSDGLNRVVPNLDILRDSLVAVVEGRQTEADPYMRQEILERSALKAARQRLEMEAKQMAGVSARNDSGLKGRQLRLWMWEWLQKLEARIAKEVERMSIDQANARRKRTSQTASSSNDGLDAESQTSASMPHEEDLLPFLGLLSPNSLGLLTIVEIMRLHGTSGVPDGTKATRALIHIGRAVENEHHMNLLRKKPHLRKLARKLSLNLRGERVLDQGLRARLRAEAEAEGANDIAGELEPWTQPIRARVGSFLIQLLMQEATVTRSARDADGKLHVEEHPAFYAAYQYVQGRKLGIIRVNEVVGERLDKENIGSVDARMLPMLVAPRPWMAHDQGGYQTTRTTAMRYKDSLEQAQYMQAASDNAELDVVLSALDVLGQTPWRVNRRVYDVISEVWNSGAEFLKIPASPFAEPEPERPVDYDTDLQAKSDYVRRLKVWSLDKANAHSRRCDLNYKLEVARAFMGERMFFPHNMDFRGRAYPIPPHLNHLGDDLCRGLLLFDDAKPLGARGLRWLQIHLANLHGFDKANFHDRQLFAEQHEKQIRASAANPLGESEDEQWWRKADDPWQCLATCIELQQAYDHPEGPEAYESRLPVHQDGTCNGLQCTPRWPISSSRSSSARRRIRTTHSRIWLTLCAARSRARSSSRR
jgi:DNA-directed RNA polymerase